MAGSPVAVVTGGSSGIGRATCERLRRTGHRTVVFDLAADEDQPGPDELSRVVDVADPHAVEAAVGDVVQRLGRIDLLVNAAGITGSPAATICHETPVEEWERVLAVNARGPFLCSRAVLPLMLARGAGHVVTIASVAGLQATPGRAAYTASKGAALQLTRSIAVDYAGHGIRANAVCPGWVHTPMTAWRLDDPTLGPAALRGVPTGRAVDAEEVAEVVALLASDRLPSVTGHAFVIDGGMTAGITL